jgi:hypothetical protein
MVQMVRDGILRSSTELRGTLDNLKQAGVVEMSLWPLARSLDQVDRIADAVEGYQA